MALWCGMSALWLLLLAFPALNGAVWLTGPPRTPPSPPLPPPFHPLTLKLVPTRKNCLKNLEIQPSAIHKVNYTKFNGILCLLLLIRDGQLQAAGCFN